MHATYRGVSMIDTTSTDVQATPPTKKNCFVFSFLVTNLFFGQTQPYRLHKEKENGEYTTQQKDNDSRMISASQLLFNTTQAGQTVTAAQALIPASSWQLSSIRNSMGNPI
jgi:hypothetical protein